MKTNDKLTELEPRELESVKGGLLQIDSIDYYYSLLKYWQTTQEKGYDYTP